MPSRLSHFVIKNISSKKAVNYFITDRVPGLESNSSCKYCGLKVRTPHPLCIKFCNITWFLILILPGQEPRHQPDYGGGFLKNDSQQHSPPSNELARMYRDKNNPFSDDFIPPTIHPPKTFHDN